MTLNDAEDTFKHTSDERIALPCGWKAHETMEDCLKALHQYYFEPETYAICFKDDPELKLIGVVEVAFERDFPVPELTEGNAEIGYFVAVEHWGKGIATEAAKCLTRRAFQVLGAKRLWGRRFSTNAKSGNVMRKLGLEYRYDREDKDEQTGEVSMLSLHSLDRETWETKYNTN